MSETNHNSDDRDVTNSLIDLSEFAKYVNDNKKVHKVALNDWSEAVIGWRKPGEITVKSYNAGSVKKKRVVERSFSDLHHGSIYSSQSQGDDYWSSASGINEPRAVVRCVGDDFETFPIPPWKSNIEQGTCRYVHDNGSYRTLKFMYDDRKDWYTMRKKRPEKVSTTWHHTCRRMQREVKRQLKKDMAMAERERDKLSRSRQSSARTSIEPTSGDESFRSKSRLSLEETQSKKGINTPPKLDGLGIKDNSNSATMTDSQLKTPSAEYHGKSGTSHKKEIRVKSTNSDGAVNQVRKMKTIHESEPVTPVPHYSIPSGSQMLKSASDLFIENFSSRISALEDEIKKDSKWLRKNENELTKLQSSRAKYRDAARSFKENTASNSTPRGPVKTEALTSDIFSVKPMAQKELKPLEKARNYGNKTNSYAANGEFMQGDTHGNFSNKNNFHTHLNGVSYTPELDRGQNNYKYIDSSKHTLFNTLTGTKINTQGNKKASKGFSTPSTITLCDNSSTNAISPSHNQTDSQSDAFKHMPIGMDKKPEKKGPLQNIPALLPEISGKRLEPTSIAHRLL